MLGAVVAVLCAGCSQPTQGSAVAGWDRVAQARQAAARFLTDYVDPDGRVVRRDQGGDTVSEGQSYALLLAEVAQDSDTGRRVAAWTERLRRPDGLLSYLAGPDGAVRDVQAASDADLVVAWAQQRRAGAGGRLTEAVVSGEVVQAAGVALLAAGPWAIGQPATLNPSYWVSPALRGLGLSELEAGVPVGVRAVTAGGRLPPDWARSDKGSLQPSPAPAGDVPVAQYSLDAQRLVVWLAVGCSSQERDLAASWWPVLSDPSRSQAIALGLDGSVRNGNPHPLPLVAAAAAAMAAGGLPARDRLLDRAEQVLAANPSYYGSAWVALGRTLLQTTLLDECSQ